MKQRHGCFSIVAISRAVCSALSGHAALILLLANLFLVVRLHERGDVVFEQPSLNRVIEDQLDGFVNHFDRASAVLLASVVQHLRDVLATESVECDRPDGWRDVTANRVLVILVGVRRVIGSVNITQPLLRVLLPQSACRAR